MHVEGSVVPGHRLFQATYVGIHVLVEQFEEQAEVLGVALAGRGRHEQVVVGEPRQRFAKLVGQRLLVLAVRAHLVGLVHDHEIPVATQQAVFGVLDAGHPRHGRDRLILLLPRVAAVIGPVEWLRLRRRFKLSDLFLAQDGIIRLSRGQSLAVQLHPIAHRLGHDDLDRLWEDWPSDHHVLLELAGVHSIPPLASV